MNDETIYKNGNQVYISPNGMKYIYVNQKNKTYLCKEDLCLNIRAYHCVGYCRRHRKRW